MPVSILSSFYAAFAGKVWNERNWIFVLSLKELELQRENKLISCERALKILEERYEYHWNRSSRSRAVKL